MNASTKPVKPGMYPNGRRDWDCFATQPDTPNPFVVIALGRPVLDDVAMRELAAWIRNWSRRQRRNNQSGEATP